MRLWTLHPKYLDRQGLIAVWREGLLAQAVLQGNTKGYQNHPQLRRFKLHPSPLQAIAYYLHEVREEALLRGYKFDATKYDLCKTPPLIQTTSGQLDFELAHLLSKLEMRSKANYDRLVRISKFEPHPLFYSTSGEIETWEKVK
ncbi:MAG TPA: DNA lyase [Chloroflexi bacterium]|nr:DNA lyase [Chloroflexota bacterium]HBY07073.1 DNA lyase [Chloroflexota bacterium]